MAETPGGERERKLWEIVRRALIMVLGAIDEYMGWERTVKPRRKS